MKRLGILIFTFVISLLCINGVGAEEGTTCEYSNNNGENYISFFVAEPGIDFGKIKVNVQARNKDNEILQINNKYTYTVEFVNREYSKITDFSAKNYYSRYSSQEPYNGCPPYVVFIRYKIYSAEYYDVYAGKDTKEIKQIEKEHDIADDKESYTTGAMPLIKYTRGKDISRYESRTYFYCKLSNYIIEYNSDGEIVFAKYSDGKNLDKRLESEVKPTKSSECPTSSNAEITFIDGGRTFYVSSKNVQKEPEINKPSDLCSSHNDKTNCKSNDNPRCVWNDEYNFCSVTGLSYLSCSDANDIPPVVPKLTSYAVNILKIATPIILIIIGIIDLVKAMTKSEDEMKKSQTKLIKKLISAILVFFVISIVQFVILKVADSGETGSIRKCLKCFLNNDCDGSVYYKDSYGGCYYIQDGDDEYFECK